MTMLNSPPGGPRRITLELICLLLNYASIDEIKIMEVNFSNMPIFLLTSNGIVKTSNVRKLLSLVKLIPLNSFHITS